MSWGAGSAGARAARGPQGRDLNHPIEPMTFGNMRASGVRSLDVSPDRPFVRKRSLAGVGDRHPDNGNPPSAGAHRSRLDRG
jgi:hypothetical protein